MPVEAAGAQQRRVQHIGPVGGRQHDHRLVAGEAVHFGQDLVQGLFALIMAAAQTGAARAADAVQFVDKDDRRRVFLRLLEQVAHA